MYIVRAGAAAAADAGAALGTRAPQEPQKAKPGLIGWPQLPQMIPAGAGALCGAGAGVGAGRGAGAGAGAEVTAAPNAAAAATEGDPDGAGVTDPMTPAAVVDPIDGVTGDTDGGAATGGMNGAGAPPGAVDGVGDMPPKLGDIMGAGILGESFQGMPLLGFATGGGVATGAIAALTSARGSGGNTVRAVSSGSGSRTGGLVAGGGSGSGNAGRESTGAGFGSGAGACGRGSGLAAAFSSLPQPRQNL